MILFTFLIFDIEEISLDAHQLRLYGNHDLQLLINRFRVTSAERIVKVENDYQTSKDRMIILEFKFCQDAGEVCSKIARDKIFREMFPELHWLC